MIYYITLTCDFNCIMDKYIEMIHPIFDKMRCNDYILIILLTIILTFCYSKHGNHLLDVQMQNTAMLFVAFLLHGLLCFETGKQFSISIM